MMSFAPFQNKLAFEGRGTRYIIRRRDGFYYRRGASPHWTDDVGSATLWEFHAVAELEALRDLSSYEYDVIAISCGSLPVEPLKDHWL